MEGFDWTLFRNWIPGQAAEEGDEALEIITDVSSDEEPEMEVGTDALGNVIEASSQATDTDASVTESVSSDGTQIYEFQPQFPRENPSDPQLAGRWGPVRLWNAAQMADSRACLRWCMSIGLVRETAVCRTARVQKQLMYREERDYAYWYCPKCRDQQSVLHGSIFSESHLPLSQALMLLLCYAKGFTYESATDCCIFSETSPVVSDSAIASRYLYYRQQLVSAYRKMMPDTPLGGFGVVVQADEAIIGRRKYERGRKVDGTWVVGMIDEEGLVRLEVCKKRDKPTLHGILKRHVNVASILHTDKWRGYMGLGDYFMDHKVVNHSREFIADDGTHTQRIESLWRDLRRRFSPGGRRHEHIPEILDEYAWQRNCRRLGRDPFAEIVKLFRI